MNITYKSPDYVLFSMDNEREIETYSNIFFVEDDEGTRNILISKLLSINKDINSVYIGEDLVYLKGDLIFCSVLDENMHKIITANKISNVICEDIKYTGINGAIVEYAKKHNLGCIKKFTCSNVTRLNADHIRDIVTSNPLQYLNLHLGYKDAFDMEDINQYSSGQSGVIKEVIITSRSNSYYYIRYARNSKDRCIKLCCSSPHITPKSLLQLLHAKNPEEIIIGYDDIDIAMNIKAKSFGIICDGKICKDKIAKLGYANINIYTNNSLLDNLQIKSRNTTLNGIKLSLNTTSSISK